MKKGLFITLEGADGVGKTTQANRLIDYFKERGLPALVTREPGGTPAGERLRALVLDPAITLSARAEALIYLAARAEHAARVIKPALNDGVSVLCDRFSDSTYVYQGEARGLSADGLMPAALWAADGLAPDLTFLLDAEAALLSERRLKRGPADRLEQEGLAFQRKVREGFLRLAQKEPDRIILINALLSVEEIQALIRHSVETRLFKEGILK